MISSYRINGTRVEIKTPYCGAVIEQCRKWTGKWSKEANAWVLPVSRLAAVQEMLGVNLDDQVEVEVRAAIEERPARTCDDGSVIEYRPARPGYDITDNCYHLGWYVIASRRGRDDSADVYADLVDGEIPDSGGSMKNPTVSGKGCAFRLWVPRDFAAARGLTVVTDPAPPAAAELELNHMAWFSDDQIRAEFVRRGIAI